MKSIALLFIPFLFTATSALGQADKLEFPHAGFKMNVLEPSQTPPSTYLVFSMSLPPTEDFAPNVNVMVEPFSGTVKEYKKMSMDMFELLEVELLNVKTKKGALIFEYEGDRIAPRELHVYSRVIFDDGKAFIATGTATPDQWEEHGEQLKEVVDSIEEM